MFSGRWIYAYMYQYISRNIRDQSLRTPTGAISRDRRVRFLILATFSWRNGLVESSMRWAPTSRFERSNRELLALYICRNMTVFVVHKGSLEVPGVPGASRGVPGASQGRPPVSQGRARASQGRPLPRGSLGSQGAPGTSRASPGYLS